MPFMWEKIMAKNFYPTNFGIFSKVIIFIGMNFFQLRTQGRHEFLKKNQNFCYRGFGKDVKEITKLIFVTKFLKLIISP
jgi:hypothetical protein